MKQTPARTRFKDRFGHANHYLVTALVALDHLKVSDVNCAPDYLRTSWNPKDKNSSVERTRGLVLVSFLGSAVDSIDMYISILHRKPNYIRNQELSQNLDRAGRSVYDKVVAVGDHYAVTATTMALVDLLITWRNNTVHALGENRLRANTREVLASSSLKIAEDYRGLQTSDLADKAEHGDVLTFKEAASLVNATHQFVEQVDAAVIARLDIAALCREIVSDALAVSGVGGSFSAKYYHLPLEKRRRFVRNWLVNTSGIAEVLDAALDSCLAIPPTKRAP